MLLSIDVGTKNLAYCAIRYLKQKKLSSGIIYHWSPTLRI